MYIYVTDLSGDTPLEDSYTITRMFGNVQVTVKFGDLLAEGTHCIVNSTNEDLDMSIGMTVLFNLFAFK
jgi:hypothetical protein